MGGFDLGLMLTFVGLNVVCCWVRPQDKKIWDLQSHLEKLIITHIVLINVRYDLKVLCS